MTKKELKAVRSLRPDRDIRIRHADKGSCMMGCMNPNTRIS
jgi:hypothetical protein